MDSSAKVVSLVSEAAMRVIVEKTIARGEGSGK